MRYAQIRELDVTNGDGIGVSLFVQGCNHHCPGCFNQDTWDFDGGILWTNEKEKEFIELAGRPFVSRISFLGGEPLAPKNISDVAHIIAELRWKYRNKKIWLWTGYSWDFAKGLKFIYNIDYIVDGRFELDKQDFALKYRGSSNQRVIDVKATLEAGKVIELYKSV